MPRKKQGLRSYHHKSRNGCLQCKRRRVKCSMTAPSCANCTRRNEECEYPDFIDVPGSSLALARSESRNRSLESLYQATGGVDGHLHADLQYRPVNQSHDLQAIIAPSIDQTVGSLLKYIMVQSWFAPQETQLWSAAILKNATKYKYLQHCIYGLALLRRDLTDRQAPFKTAPEAFDHQVAASALFRLEAPVITPENYVSVVAFHVCMLIFQLSTQSSCPIEDFDLIQTLRMLRSSRVIDYEAAPYFQKSRFWQMILARNQGETFEVDQPLQSNLSQLVEIITDSVVSGASSPDDEERAAINLQALNELTTWTYACQANPRRWYIYCDWPANVNPEFLDLLEDGDDVALVITVHWCAVMNRSNKVPVQAWAQRAGWQAAEKIHDKARWDSLLSWPLSTLRQERKEWPIKVDLQPYLHLAGHPAPREASSAVVPSNDTDYSQTFSQDTDQLSWHADQIRRIEIAAATTSMSYEPSLAYAQPVMFMPDYSLPTSAIDPTLHMMGTTGVTFMPTVAFDNLQHSSGVAYAWTDHSSGGQSSRSASVEDEDFSVLLSSNTH